jgi:hypothetical protein
VESEWQKRAEFFCMSAQSALHQKHGPKLLITSACTIALHNFEVCRVICLQSGTWGKLLFPSNPGLRIHCFQYRLLNELRIFSQPNSQPNHHFQTPTNCFKSRKREAVRPVTGTVVLLKILQKAIIISHMIADWQGGKQAFG